jgi:hypothetical protein
MQVLVLVADGCEELETVTFTDLIARSVKNKENA